VESLCNKQQAILCSRRELFPSKARCPFTQYIPSRPDKFGIKFWILSEVDSKYLCNGFPYVGKDEHRVEHQSLGEFVVFRLMEPFWNRGYNITCDNFFTSFNLAKAMLKKKTTLVGTMRMNRRELPPSVKDTRTQALYDTQAFTCDGISMTCYRAKQTQNVVIYSALAMNM